MLLSPISLNIERNSLSKFALPSGVEISILFKKLRHIWSLREMESLAIRKKDLIPFFSHNRQDLNYHLNL